MAEGDPSPERYKVGMRVVDSQRPWKRGKIVSARLHNGKVLFEILWDGEHRGWRELLNPSIEPLNILDVLSEELGK